jgi:hypothetical protein
MLTRNGWAVATMIMYFLMICGHNSTALYFSKNSYICLFGAIMWPAYIISPIVYMNMYSRVKEAIYMTMLSNCVLGMGGIMYVILITFAFLMVLQYPIETIVSKTIRKLLLGEMFQEKREKWLDNCEKWWVKDKRKELRKSEDSISSIKSYNRLK